MPLAWDVIQGGSTHGQKSLAQGDLLPGCFVPHLELPASELELAAEPIKTFVEATDLIVMTQSCDLVVEGKRQPNDFVALCPYAVARERLEGPPTKDDRNRYENLRKGRVSGLHLVPCISESQDAWDSIVVDFTEVFSLPFKYLSLHASQLDSRHRLRSPFLEHLSQAFARFYMRVGLPDNAIPQFKP